jgi:hypothetical protein
MNYNLAALLACPRRRLHVHLLLPRHPLGPPPSQRRLPRLPCRRYAEDAANEALWAPIDEGRAYANDLLRSRALLVVTSGDDYGYAAKANYAEVLRIAAASDSPFPYFDAVCEVSARIETENDPVWRAL